ncbi:MAG: hypothetical protein U0T56_03355 [Ferruginibacter sp.]
MENFPVVNKQGRLIGLITFGDILNQKLSQFRQRRIRTPDRWSRRGHHHGYHGPRSSSSTGSGGCCLPRQRPWPHPRSGGDV